MHPSAEPDEFTLLCERCGYTIEGLPPSSPCPECAAPIESSLPDRARPGSPYQLNPSRAALVATARAMLLRPRQTLRSMQIGSVNDEALKDKLLLDACRIVSILLFIAMLTHAVSSYIHRPDRWLSTLSSLGLMFLFWLLIALQLCTFGVLLLSMLCRIESVGIRAFGRVHKRRITPAVASSICAHASIGWMTGAILGTLPLIGIAAITPHAGPSVLPILLIPLGLFLGLLHFEILIYLGVRTCPYANRARPPSIPS